MVRSVSSEYNGRGIGKKFCKFSGSSFTIMGSSEPSAIKITLRVRLSHISHTLHLFTISSGKSSSYPSGRMVIGAFLPFSPKFASISSRVWMVSNAIHCTSDHCRAGPKRIWSHGINSISTFSSTRVSSSDMKKAPSSSNCAGCSAPFSSSNLGSVSSPVFVSDIRISIISYLGR